MADKRIAYRPMTVDDIDEVKRLLFTSFFKFEPLTTSLGIENPRESRGFVDLYTPGFPDYGVSIVAIDTKSDKMIGCGLSSIATPDHPDEALPRDKDNDKMNVLMDFLGYLNEGYNLFDLYKVDKVMRLKVFTVDPDYGGMGIGKHLIQERMLLARDKGIPLAVAEATGNFSQSLYLNKFGFNTLKTAPYSDYRVNGKHVFTNTGIHKSCKLVVRLLKNFVRI